MKIYGDDLASPKWLSIEINFSDFSATELTEQLAAYTLPDGCKLHDLFLVPETDFAGTGITAMTLSVGIAATPAKYATAFDVTQTANQQNSENSEIAWGSGISFIVEGKSTGANLDQLTAGKASIKMLISRLI